MTDQDTLLQTLHEVREDIRVTRQLDQEDHKALHKRVDDLCDILDKHDKYWSVTFFIGKMTAWVIATVTAIVGSIMSFFK